MRIALSFAFVITACTSNGTQVVSDETTTHPEAPPIAPFDECTVYTARENGAAFTHVSTCSTLDLATYPPTGGHHYPVWAAFQTYESPVPWGFLIHSMEHGAVVVAYRCDEACPELVASLEAVIDARPEDPLCDGLSSTRRVILVPDPELDWPIAAVAWERKYLATCFDEASLSAFIDAAYGRGREDFCHDGQDLSDVGWCP